jgi:hypothetical protein
MEKVVLGEINGKCWKASCGYCEPERRGKIFPGDFHLIRRVIADFSTGKSMARLGRW